MGSRGKAPLIFNIPPHGGEWLTAHLGCFTPGKEPQYPLNRRLVGLHTESGHFWRREKSLACTGI